MSKSKTLAPIRIEQAEKTLLESAAKKTGVSLASKMRELALAWARKVLK